MVLESGKITQEGVDRFRARLGNFNRPRQYGEGLFNRGEISVKGTATVRLPSKTAQMPG